MPWTKHALSTKADGTRSVFAADVDGDGDLDVLSASIADDTIAWYEQIDSDDDGFNDDVEVMAGTNPLDALSHPPAASVPALGGPGGALLAGLGVAAARRRREA